jgi:drug/metabolite transporter (DMT)-like permease
MNFAKSFKLSSIFPLSVALLWGLSVVVQKCVVNKIGVFTYNAARLTIAAAFVYFIYRIQCITCKKYNSVIISGSKKIKKELFIGGLLCGITLAGNSFFLQAGLETTDAGKGGFINSLYIVFVPVLNLIFCGKRPSRGIVASIPLALSGLYCLCGYKNFYFQKGDLFLITGAFCFAIQILLTDYYANRLNSYLFCSIQLSVSAIISIIGMFMFEGIDLASIYNCLMPILYNSVFGCGIALVLQTLSQKITDPAVASIMFSVESVFTVILAAFLINEQMSAIEYIGCALVLGAVFSSQK